MNCRLTGLVAGLDEAGRAPLAGPVVSSCVVWEGLPPVREKVNDSKLLTDEQRRRLLPAILECAVAHGLGCVEPEEIDRINILQASLKAMRLALESMECDAVIVDGRHPIPGVDIFQHVQPKADSTSLSVAAASIIAKVTRDDMMVELDRRYPGYDLAFHKGYATHAHFEALDQLGPCPVHRQTFLVRWREFRKQQRLSL